MSVRSIVLVCTAVVVCTVCICLIVYMVITIRKRRQYSQYLTTRDSIRGILEERVRNNPVLSTDSTENKQHHHPLCVSCEDASGPGKQDLPVLYINLDRSPMRKLRFTAQADALNIKYTRIPAVDGVNVSPHLPNHIDGVYVKNDFPGISATETACTMSPLKAIKYAHDHKYKMALILEDDVSFDLVRAWPEHILQRLIRAVPSNMGILQLSWLQNASKTCKFCDYIVPTRAPLQTPCDGAVAYIVTQRGMSDILKTAYVSNTMVHIKKTHAYQKYGVADAYLFNLTRTCTSGLPLFMANNAGGQMDTTMVNRKGGVEHTLIHLEELNKVLRVYEHHLVSNRPIMFKAIRDGTEYRLSDAIQGNYQPTRTKQNHIQWYPDSLVTQYFRKTNTFGDVDVLAEVVRENLVSETFQRASADTVVVHLRLGDVLDECAYSVDDHLEKDLPYSKMPKSKSWVKPKTYFDEALQKFPRVRKVVLVYGSHLPNLKLTKSKEYVRKLTEHLKAKGYSVSVHNSSNVDADDDFMFLATAPNLVITGGGYSALAQKINMILRSSK